MSIQVKRRVEWNKSPWFPPQVLRAGPEAAWGKYKSEHHVFTRSTEFCVDGHWGHRGTENTVLWLQLRLLNLLLHMLLHSIHNLQDIQWHPSIPSIWNWCLYTVCINTETLSTYIPIGIYVDTISVYQLVRAGPLWHLGCFFRFAFHGCAWSQHQRSACCWICPCNCICCCICICILRMQNLPKWLLRANSPEDGV